MLKIFNTLSKKKENFKPLEDKKVRIYSCGPTVYFYPHIGNYRAYIAADLLHRALLYLGYKVKLIMNITDVDDKTIRDSQKQKKKLNAFTKPFIKGFFEDLVALNILPADIYPRATEHIPDMVKMIKLLLKNGLAYKAKDDCIYYSINKFKNYGKLAHLDKEQLMAGASGIRSDEYSKENVRDFALWKAYSKEDGNVFWNTEIGKGRPGWHIECSAMSTHYLGKSFDIHTGGVDLIFPHHENEIAQSEGAFNVPFVKYWVHNEWLLVEGKKMSKSLGNFYTLRDLLEKGFDSFAVRYLLLAAHYRQQLNFTFKGLDAAKNSLQRIWDFIERLESVEGRYNTKFSSVVIKYSKKFKSAVSDDLDTPKALAVMFDFIKDTNRLIEKNDFGRKNAKEALNLMKEFDSVLGLLKEKENISKVLLDLINKREQARKNKDFKLADKIRNDLKNKGILLEDSSSGVRWKKI